MKLNITLDGGTYSATLEDNPTARDLWAKLPLEGALENLGNNEKILYLADKLGTKNTPSAYTGKACDITYYAPWGNIALFLDKGPYAPGLILLGHFDGDLNALKQSKRIKFERAE